MATKRDKAAALLASGAVKPYRLKEGGGGVRAHVRGESGVYESAAWFEGGRIRYSCTCDYSTFHEAKPECSHALACALLIDPPTEGGKA